MIRLTQDVRIAGQLVPGDGRLLELSAVVLRVGRIAIREYEGA